jgi:HEAT repeat protein
MKGSNVTSFLGKAGIVLMLVTVFATSVAAQKFNVEKRNIKENAIKSLIVGISHENDGVRKCAIYYCGKYFVKQTVKPLIDQLDNEKNPELRLLIVLSLYNIGEPEGLNAIYKVAATDKDERVKKMSTAIYYEFLKDKELMAFSTPSM